MKAWLEWRGMPVKRKPVQRLMRAIYRRPGTSRRTLEHPVYTYLLGNVRITRPNEVWVADITYPPMARGFLYLLAVMDWHSRYVLAWLLPKTLEAGFCAETLGGRVEYRDNIFVERLWRTVKYEEVHVQPYASVLEAQRGLEDYFRFYD